MLLPLSVRLSVRPSVPLCYLLNRCTKSSQTMLSGIFTQVGRARAHLFFAPPPGAMGRGQNIK